MKKWIWAILFMVCLVSLAIGETPSSDNIGSIRRGVATVGTKHNHIQPVWQRLALMDFATRQNSNIDIDINGNAGLPERQLADEIESIWNAGRYDEALGMFSNLETITENEGFSIGISWKTPVKNDSGDQTILWEQDIQINYQDSVYQTTLNAHQATGNLFSVLLIQDGPFQLFSVNFSADKGATWVETYYYVSSDILPSVGAAVMGNRCYVAYPLYNSIRLKCFDVVNGLQAEFIDSTSTARICTFSNDDTLKEISLISNQNQYNNRLYCCAITNQGRLIYCWAGADALPWNSILTGIGNADRGLDACFNEQFGNYYLYISYIDRSDRMNMFGRQNQTGPEQDEAGALGR